MVQKDILKNLKNKPVDIRCLLLLFMFTIYPLVVIPNPIGYTTLPRYIILIAISLLALYALIREKVDIKHPVLIPLGAFLFFLCLSTVLAEEPGTALTGSFNRFTGFSTYICCVILFLTALACSKENKLLHYMVGGAAVVSSLGVLQFFGINLVPDNPAISFTGTPATIGNPNFFGTYVALALPASIIFYLQSKKLPWILCSALIYAGMLVCVTRGIWLSSFVSFIIIAIYFIRFKDKRRPFAAVVVAFLITSIILFPARDGLIMNRVFSISGEVESAVQLEEKAGSHRIFIWKESLKLFPEYWAFGMGPDNLMYAGIHTPGGKLADKVHNIYIEIAVTMGVFALLSYLAFLAFVARSLRYKRGNQFLFSIIFFTYLLQGFFNIDVVQVLPLFWIVLGLAIHGTYKKESPYYSDPMPPHAALSEE